MGLIQASRPIRKEHYMDLQLQGKSVFVTGASKGIGLACALAFNAEGVARVLIIKSCVVACARAAFLSIRESNPPTT